MTTDIKKTNLKDIRHGEMNYLQDPSTQPKFDPNRAQIVNVMKKNTAAYYTADLLKGKRRWNAIVLRSTSQSYAYVSSEFQRTYTAYERSNKEGKFVHFTYKIFIAELDSFRKLPREFSKGKAGEGEGLLNLCRDAIAPLGRVWGEIDYGTPVEVVFEDQERLRNPIIIDVHWNRRIALQKETDAKSLFKGAPRIARESMSTAADTGPPIAHSAGRVRDAKSFYEDLERAGIKCEALRHGILVNALNESRFDPSIVGDPIKYLGAPGKHGGIKTSYPGSDAWRPRGEKLYSAFGLFQMNIASKTALGWQMLKWQNMTEATNSDKLAFFTGEAGYTNQIEFMVHKLETGYPSVLDCSRYRTSQQYHDFWLDNIEQPALSHRPGRKSKFKRNLKGLGFEPIE